jgi:hypothetical protein
VLLWEKHFDEAIPFFKKAREMFEENCQFFFHFFYAYLGLGRKTEANEIMLKVLELASSELETSLGDEIYSHFVHPELKLNPRVPLRFLHAGEVSDKDMSLLIEMFKCGSPAGFPKALESSMNGKRLFWWLVVQGRYEDAMHIDIGELNSCT